MFSLFHCCDGGGGGGRAAVGIVRPGKYRGRKEELLDIAPPLLHTFLSSSSLAARSARTVSTQILIFAPAPDVRRAWRGLCFLCTAHGTCSFGLKVCSKNPNVGIAVNSTDSRAAEGERISLLSSYFLALVAKVGRHTLVLHFQ